MEIDLDLLISPKKRELSDMTLRTPFHIWTDTGRSAIFLAIEDMEKYGCKKIVYLPAFICDAVIQPFIEKGFKINFYSMGKDLKYPAYLPEKLNNEIFLFVNYFGHENKAILKWLADKKSRYDFFVIEDSVQSTLSVFGNPFSDYKVYSYRKFTSQPDGGLLISKKMLKLNKLLNIENKEFLSAQIEGKITRALSKDDEKFLALLKQSEASLNGLINPKSLSEFSMFLMERIDFEEIIAIRRQNWQLLMDQYQKNAVLQEHFYPLNFELRSNEVPLGFPILIRNGKRDGLRQYLIERDIFCPIHWMISSMDFDNDLNISADILTLPIDQRMTEGHIFYLIDNLLEYFKGVKKW